MAENRSLAYALADNIIGFDDGYESLGERAGAALRDDPMGVARTVGGALYDSARDFGARFVRNPAGAVTDTANELGLGYVEAGQRLAGGIGAYTDQGMSVDEARDAQLMDALTVSELLGGGVFANQLRRGIMPSVDVGGSGPADPSRREFLKRSAATAGVAAVAPDAVREIMDVLPGAARRAVGANPLAAAVSQISKLRKQADEMSEVAAGRGELPFGNRDEYRRATFAKYDEIADTRSAALDALDADTLANASDADLDTFVREFYDYNLSGYDSVNSSDFEHPAYDALVMEMQKRGLHKQTDRQGLDKYPYARAMVEDYGIKTRKEGEFPRPADIDAETANKRIADAFSHAAQLRDAKLNMGRETPESVAPEIENLNFKNMYRNLENEIVTMRDKGRTEAEIEAYRSAELARINRAQGLPPDMDDFYANGGPVTSDESFNEMRASLESAIDNMSDEEFESAYGQSKSAARKVLDMLIVQRYHGASYEDGVPSAYRMERDAQLALESKMGEAPPEAAMSETTGMVGMDAEGNLVEYGVGSLNETAANMYRGPRSDGIGDYEQFAMGGHVQHFDQGGAAIAAKQASPDDLAKLASKIRNDYGFDPVAVALDIGVDPELALRLVYQESRGDQSAGSNKGAKGLTQLMPGTAEELGVNPDDPLQNFVGGMTYLKNMTDRFGLELGLAAYNAGPGNVSKYGGVPPFKETQDYLRIILEPFQGQPVQPLLDVGAENYLMAQPVAAVGDYSPKPKLRPVDLDYFPQPVDPMPRPQLRPGSETPVEAEVEEALLQRERPTMVQKYGLPGDMPAGIGSLNQMAKNMYS